MQAVSFTALCRRLGVQREASFEEVQDARDFLFAVSFAFLIAQPRLLGEQLLKIEQGCLHSANSAHVVMCSNIEGMSTARESIELAYDRILQEKMNVRHKHGFKPVRTGRKTDVQGDAEVSCTAACSRMSALSRPSSLGMRDSHCLYEPHAEHEKELPDSGNTI